MKRGQIVLLGMLVVLGMLLLLQRMRHKKEAFYQDAKAAAKGSFFNGAKEALLVVDLEVANTPKAIEQGLMNRQYIAPNTGMLFWFEKEEPRSFWMRNTLVPLDMIFITSTGRITNIHHAVPPNNDTLRSSAEPVQYVVELPGGTAAKHQLTAGDRFSWTY